VLLSRELDPTTPASDRTRQAAEIDLRPHEHRQVAMQFIMPPTADGKTLYGRVVAVRFE
jgi:hypothetical protein